MTIVDQLNLDAASRESLAVYCYRQAASHFETVHRYREAAECWHEAGEVDRAVALLRQEQDWATTARLLWQQNRFREALECGQRWLEQLAATDVAARVPAQLLLAACYDRLDGSADRCRAAYRQARAQLESAELPSWAQGECWRAVGEFGSRVGRWDLVSLGYEQALRCFAGDRSKLPEVLREYLVAVPGNRLLTQRLREQLAEFEMPRRRQKPQGEALRAAAEQIREVRRFEGHTSQVYCVSFSPDGRLLASGSGDKTVRLWDPDTGEEVRCLQGHQGPVYSVSFSPDGRLLASGSMDETVRLWDPDTGEEVRCLQGHQGPAYSVSFSPDGRLLASGSDDQTVRLWNPATGQEARCLQGHQDCVRSVSFSPDGRLLASGSDDQTVRLWDPDTGEAVCCLQGHQDPVCSVSFTPDGRLLASGDSDNTVLLWNPTTGQEVRRMNGPGMAWRIAFTADGRILIAGFTAGPICVWEVATWDLIATLNRASPSVGCLAVSMDGRFLVSGAEPNQMWDISSLVSGIET